MKRFGAALGVVLVTAVAAAGCVLPLSTVGSTASIQFVSTTTTGGWKYDFYRNSAYPCAISGSQTFVIATLVGSSATAARPLFVHMHGGGAGYFDTTGHPVPGTGQKVEESAASLNQKLNNNGLFGKVRADAAGFRMVAVSYCSHDVYAGVSSTDPNNPNLDAAGKPRTTNGILATKAAIQFAKSKYPTTKTFLHGGSAGSAGTFGVAWSMQLQGIAPAGLVADASIVNAEAFQAGFAAGICTEDNDPVRTSAIAARVHPDLANIANEPDKVVADGRLTVPIMHIWNHADSNTCGSPPVSCPLRDGSTVTLGYTDCIHEPMQLAIAAQGPTSRSRNLPVCVTPTGGPECSVHVVSNKVGGVNTDPASPADYQTAIMDWIRARLADG
jgi:hypothetical protein